MIHYVHKCYVIGVGELDEETGFLTDGNSSAKSCFMNPHYIKTINKNGIEKTSSTLIFFPPNTKITVDCMIKLKSSDTREWEIIDCQPCYTTYGKLDHIEVII